ncbi:MAG: hypothetical protein NT096_15330 [Proteobacteria bacterium]|nr:hypothetical protein [Pseudomonadota bacterium]
MTRFFSVAQWYHLAFMVVSIALLGIGASGSILMLFPALRKTRLERIIPITTFALSLTALGSYLIANHIPFEMVRLSYDYRQFFYLFFYYLLFSLPFFFGGLTIALALSQIPSKANSIYSADLFGAGSGCLLALLIHALGGVTLCLFTTCTLSVITSIITAVKNSKWLLTAGGSLLLFIVFLFIQKPMWFQLKISPYKDLQVTLRYPEAKHLLTCFNAFSQVDVIESPAVRFAPGLSLKYMKPLPPQLGFTVDGSNLNSITRYQGNKEELIFTSYLPSAFPYYLRKVKSALILEPQGGLDVLTALYHGAEEIEGTEKNPLLADLISQRFAGFTGGVFQRQDVKMIREEGRVYLSRTAKSYDLIESSLTSTLGASSGGMFGLVEEYPLTKEAFSLYYDHLNPDGYLSFTLYLIPPPRQELRLISTIISMLENKRIPDPERHFMLIRSWGICTILVKKGSIGREEILTGSTFLKRCNFDWVYYPGITPEETNIYNLQSEPVYYRMASSLLNRERSNQFIREYLFDVSPVTDDRPFFYHYFKVERTRETYLSAGKKWQFLLEGGYFIPLVFFQSLLISIIFILLPSFLSPRRGETGVKSISLLSYFLFIGVGFMFIEIPLIQRFILFLGHPVYAFSICLLSLLISSGAGSLLSGKLVPPENRVIHLFLFFSIGVVTILYAYFLPILFSSLGGLNLVSRQILSCLVIFPIGFLLGMPFPLGIRLLGNRFPAQIPWAWCINGCASVVSSVGAMMIALRGGFGLVLNLAALFYFFALCSLLLTVCRKSNCL